MSLLHHFGNSKTAFKQYVSPWKFTCEDSMQSFQVGDIVYTHDNIVTNKYKYTNMSVDSQIICVITSKQTAMRMLEIVHSAFEKEFVDNYDGETRAQERAQERAREARYAPVVTPPPVHTPAQHALNEKQRQESERRRQESERRRQESEMQCKQNEEHRKVQREETRKKLYPILRTALPESTDGLYYEISISNELCYGDKHHKSVVSTIVASHEISKVLGIKMDLDKTRVTGERISLPTLKPNHMFSMFYHQDKRCEIMEDMIKQLITDVHRLQTQLEQSQQLNEIKFKRRSSKTIA